MSITDDELIQKAESALNSQKIDDLYVADVGCAIVSYDDQVFTGACIGGYLGICAEQSAISQLVTKTEPRIKKLVAVWKNEQGELYILPPCGRCREFLRCMSQDNLDAEIILGKDHVTKLRDLLPFHGWHAEKV
jgi:cytidine deaminase